MEGKHPQRLSRGVGTAVGARRANESFGELVRLEHDAPDWHPGAGYPEFDEPDPRRSRVPAALLLALLALLPLAFAAAVYVGSGSIPEKYQANATLRVSIPGGPQSGDSVGASNDLATQYAQLASAQPVQRAAARRLKVPASELDGKVSASTLAAQNLIEVSAAADEPAKAKIRATAVGRSLRTYINDLNADQVRAYARRVQSRLKGVDAQIARQRRAIANDPDSRESELGSLLASRNDIEGDIAQSAAASQPSLQLVSPATSASKVQPRPVLYAGIAFLLVALICARLGFGLVRRRRSHAI